MSATSATNLAEGHSVRSVKSDFTARNVGRYEDKIDLHDAIIVDADGKDVTRNYVLTYQPGTLEITPFEGEVVVTVTGNTGLFRYDGKIHTVEGYTLEATVPFFTEDDIRFTGDATISEVRPGDYVMNLKDEEFSAANDNFTSVKFVVIDGSHAHLYRALHRRVDVRHRPDAHRRFSEPLLHLHGELHRPLGHLPRAPQRQRCGGRRSAEPVGCVATTQCSRSTTIRKWTFS